MDSEGIETVSIYQGETKSGKRPGLGEMRYNHVTALDCGSYDGEWKDGMKHGHGVFKSDEGMVYTGEWKND